MPGYITSYSPFGNFQDNISDLTRRKMTYEALFECMTETAGVEPSNSFKFSLGHDHIEIKYPDGRMPNQKAYSRINNEEVEYDVNKDEEDFQKFVKLIQEITYYLAWNKPYFGMSIKELIENS